MEEIKEYQTITLLASFVRNPTTQHVINTSNVKIGELHKLFSKVHVKTTQERLSLKPIVHIVGGEKLVIVI